MDVKIRKPKLEDLDTLMTISRKTINASYRSFLGDENVNWFLESGSSEEYVKDNINVTDVILLNEKIIGYSVYKDNMIDLMLIDDDFHRKANRNSTLETQ